MKRSKYRDLLEKERRTAKESGLPQSWNTSTLPTAMADNSLSLEILQRPHKKQGLTSMKQLVRSNSNLGVLRRDFGFGGKHVRR